MTVTQSELGEAVTAPARVKRQRQSYDADKAPLEIEDDILQARRHLGTTIDALERRLAPRRLIARSTETFRKVLEGDTEHLAARLRENALPLLLIVAGAAWLLLTRSHRRYCDATLGKSGERALDMGLPPEAGNQRAAPSLRRVFRGARR